MTDQETERQELKAWGMLVAKAIHTGPCSGPDGRLYYRTNEALPCEELITTRRPVGEKICVLPTEMSLTGMELAELLTEVLDKLVPPIGEAAKR